MCLPVPQFPNGIKEAFDSLGKKFGVGDRDYYGISWMEGERIMYMAAAATKFDGEEKEFTYKPFTITRGAYLFKTLHNWMENTDRIKDTFMELMKHPEFDFKYPCIEWYKDDVDMECWARSKQHN